MSNQIEMYDRLRKKIRGLHVIGFLVFFVFWIFRSILKIARYSGDMLFTIVMVALLLSISWMGYFGIRLLIIERNIRKNPVLNQSLYNELVKLNELKSWRSAFFTLIIFNLIAGSLIVLVPVLDPMLFVVTSLLVGFGSFTISLHLLDR